MSRSTETPDLHRSQSQNPPDLVELAVQGDRGTFTSLFKDVLAEEADRQIVSTLIEDAADGDPTPEEEDEEVMAIMQIDGTAKYCGGYICGVEDGVIDVCIKSAYLAQDFAQFLDNYLAVEDYDVYEIQEYDSGDPDVIDVTVDHETYDNWSNVPLESNSEFQFIIYLEGDLVAGDDVILDASEAPDEQSGEIYEVMKIVKINFRGKKVIRMKCQKGYKYDAKQHACVKREEHDLFLRRRKAQLNMLRRVAAKAAIKKKINHKSLRFLLNRKKLGIGY